MICILVFIIMLSAVSALSDSAENYLAFVPELLTTAYNQSLDTVFTALQLDSSTVSSIVDYATVNYITTEGDSLVYTNSAQTVFVFFGGQDRYSLAEHVMFYTSLKDDSPVKNLPQYAFTYAVCQLDSSCDYTTFGAWANDATDGDEYQANSFSATYILHAADSSSIVLMKQ